MDHWCRIPELDHLPFNIQKAIAIPKETEDGEEVYSSCSYYQRNYTNYTREDWEKWGPIPNPVYHVETTDIFIKLHLTYGHVMGFFTGFWRHFW